MRTPGAHSRPLLDDELRARCRAWAEEDPDPVTAAEIEALVAATDGEGPAAATAATELADRFCGPLEFGTAGLRGALGGGEHRMNRAVVIRAAAGLTAYLRRVLESDPNAEPEEATAAGWGPGPRVVIGYDARHGSAEFARDTAAVVTAGAGSAVVLPRPLPTPVLAFAVRRLGADAGVMVTASHNPRGDNGYKVYLGGRVAGGAAQGAQIVSPADAEIAARIRAVEAVSDVPRAPSGWRVLGEDLVDAYVERAAGGIPEDAPRELRIVLTPLHGVGGDLAVRALGAAGFTDVHLVAEQAAPDPEFPTVAVPNPEEPGVLDLAIATARRVGADLVIAHDPDADRCAVAVPDPGAAGWRALTGDEVGALLGREAAGRAAAKAVLACSVVSSRLLARIAAAHGLAHRTTLTGFKWIARVEGLAFGYEEALGYCTDPDIVRDKDGITAAVRVAVLAAALRAAGSDLAAALDEIARVHGLHATVPLSVRVTDASVIAAAMARLRADPPAMLGGAPVTTVVDLSHGWDDLPPTEGLVYDTAAGDRVVVRPSGTEPKLKCYLEAVVPVHGDDITTARGIAAERLSALRGDVSRAAGLSEAVGQ